MECFAADCRARVSVDCFLESVLEDASGVVGASFRSALERLLFEGGLLPFRFPGISRLFLHKINRFIGSKN